MPTWTRLSSRTRDIAANHQARKEALERQLRALGGPATIQEVRRALGMKSKSSLYSSCWRPLIDEAIKQGRIERPLSWRSAR
jgi:hypothetical protein